MHCKHGVLVSIPILVSLHYLISLALLPGLAYLFTVSRGQRSMHVNRQQRMYCLGLPIGSLLTRLCVGGSGHKTVSYTLPGGGIELATTLLLNLLDHLTSSEYNHLIEVKLTL